MPFDAGGNFSRNYNFEQDRINGIKIMSARVDGEFDNFAAGLNLTFLRTGAVPMGGNLRMNGYSVTQLADGTALNPSLSSNSDVNTGIYTPTPGQIGFSVSGVNKMIISSTGITLATPLSVGQGGTGGTTASTARSNLSAAALGANTDITSLSGLTTPLSVGQGGTGTSGPLNGIAKFNGASPMSVVTAPAGAIVGTTDAQTLTNKTIEPAGTIKETVFGITDGAAFEIDPANGSIQTITLGANRTPKGTNFQNGQAITLGVDDGTAFTLTWTDATFGGTGVKWVPNGTAPVLATTGYNWITLWKVGGQVYGTFAGSAG